MALQMSWINMLLFFVGLNTSTAPIWQVETSKVQLRGKLVILENVLVLVGFSLANWLNYGFSFANGPVSWRFPLSFQLLFNIILFCTVPWLPESPRYQNVSVPLPALAN